MEIVESVTDKEVFRVVINLVSVSSRYYHDASDDFYRVYDELDNKLKAEIRGKE